MTFDMEIRHDIKHYIGHDIGNDLGHDIECSVCFHFLLATAITVMAVMATARMQQQH